MFNGEEGREEALVGLGHACSMRSTPERENWAIFYGIEGWEYCWGEGGSWQIWV